MDEVVAFPTVEELEQELESHREDRGIGDIPTITSAGSARIAKCGGSIGSDCGKTISKKSDVTINKMPPREPISAYMFYLKDNRGRIIVENKGIADVALVEKKCASAWGRCCSCYFILSLSSTFFLKFPFLTHRSVCSTPLGWAHCTIFCAFPSSLFVVYLA